MISALRLADLQVAALLDDLEEIGRKRRRTEEASVLAVT